MRLVASFVRPDLEDILRLMLNPTFVQEVADLRKEFGVNLNRWESGVDSIVQEIDDLESNENLQKKAAEMAKKFGISQRWNDQLVWHVVMNWMDEPELYNEDAIEVSVDMDTYPQDKRFFIELGEKTSLNDIEKHWSRIEEARKTAGGVTARKGKIRRTIKRDFQIHILFEQGKSSKEIRDFVLENFGDRLKDSTISVICTRFRKRFGLWKPKNKLKAIDLEKESAKVLTDYEGYQSRTRNK